MVQFEYAQYFNGCLIWPLVLLCFFGTGVYLSCKGVAKKIAQGCSSIGILIQELLPNAFTALMCILFCCVNFGVLIGGGLHLITEKEIDAVQIVGIIEETVPLKEYEFPRIDPEEGFLNGVCFVVDGVKCVGISKGDIKVGDHVSVVYLPESGYILSVNKIDQPLKVKP